MKQRLFAHPQRPTPKRHGGIEQLLASGAAKGFTTYDNYFSRPRPELEERGAEAAQEGLARDRQHGARPGRPGGKAPHIHFEIQPAGKGAPKIDPKPILDGWKLLESTAVYRAKGRNVLYGDGNFSIGEIMLLPKPLLVKRVLSDPRIEIYPGGRQDIQTGQIDRRVLVVLEYLAESGLEPTVSCLKGNHGLHDLLGQHLRALLGQRRRHLGDQRRADPRPPGPGDVTEQAVKRLMLLQGTLARTRSSRCSTSARTRWRCPTTPITSTSASTRCSARTRSSAARRSRC